MTPKLKARQILKQFNYTYNREKKEYIIHQDYLESKRCALILVNEILDAVSVKKTLYLTDMTYQIYSYWSKVKEELNK